MEWEELPDFPIASLPLPSELIGFRPVSKLFENDEPNKEDILLLTESSTVFCILTHVEYSDLYKKYTAHVVFTKTVKETLLNEEDLIEAHNNKEGLNVIKSVLSASADDWKIDFEQKLIVIDARKEECIIVLKKMNEETVRKYFRETVKIEKSTLLYQFDEEEDCIFTTQQAKFSNATQYELKNDLTLLSLNRTIGTSLHTYGYYRFLHLLFGFSFLGPVPLEISSNLKELTIQISKLCGIRNGIRWVDTFMLFSHTEHLQKK
jgi:hypothetical protein